MTDTTTLDTASTQDEKPRRSGALSTMKVAELQGLAASMGITGTAKMRKNDLVTAIKDRQSGGSAAARQETRPEPASTPAADRAPRRAGRGEGAPGTEGAAHAEGAARTEAAVRPDRGGETRDERPARDEAARADRRAERGEETRAGRTARDESARGDRRDERRGDQGPARGDQRGDRQGNREGAENRDGRQVDTRQGDTRRDHDRDADARDSRQGDNRRDHDRDADARGNRQADNRQADNRQSDNRQGDNRRDHDRDADGRDGDNRQQGRGQNAGQGGFDDDGEGRGRRRNRNRNRNRDKRRGGRGDFGDYEGEPQVTEDDVLVPVAGILDVLDNYAFVRTSGYLPGANDVYVPLGMVKKNGMRKGDAVTGAVKAQHDDQQGQRQKFNALVRLDTVNGMSPDDARKRVEFGKLTPLYPQQRLRLETEPHILTTRVIDLVAPIGKGQRGLIVAPAKAGKTMVMQAIANAITTNNPECHLMVVLVDERPEEVTDMQRAVKGEVISSTFDRPAEDHTTVAELAIERAKRLVEMGHDVVVLLDSITKLGRAYNLAAPASGRILSGGVDSAALYPPKKFFGAARNIENGGSLTILATALVETGSRMDEVIFEEFKGTGNMELKLDRGLANRRIFPAVDVNNSGTRKEEILLSSEELKIMWKLRRVLAALDQQQGIELLIDRIKKTKSNIEFLMQVQQTSSIRIDDDKDD